MIDNAVNTAQPFIGVIDYKAGNAPSVLNALHRQRVPAALVATPTDLARVSAIILPGVGSAAATMDSLRTLDLLDTLHTLVKRESKPFLGICIGLQILFDHSEEGDTPCLGWIPGVVRRFPPMQVRVPQMGWNEVVFHQDEWQCDAASPDARAQSKPLDSSLCAGLQASEYFYFVNSYHAVPVDTRCIFATAVYGQPFCAMIRYQNITATQFHLEKSGEAGLRLLENFSRAALSEQQTL